MQIREERTTFHSEVRTYFRSQHYVVLYNAVSWTDSRIITALEAYAPDADKCRCRTDVIGRFRAVGLASSCHC